MDFDQQEVIDFYRKRAKKNLDKADDNDWSLRYVAKKTGSEVVEHFNIESQTKKRQIRSWTEKFRNDGALDPAAINYDEDQADDWLEQYRPDRDYYYDSESEMYTFYDSPPGFETLHFPLKKVKQIIEKYSNVVHRGKTRNEVEMETQVPKPTVIHILDCLGITHDHEPYTKEEILNSDPRSQAYETYQKLARKRSQYRTEMAKMQKEDAKKYRELISSLEPIKEFFDDISYPDVDPVDYDLPNQGTGAIITIADPHLNQKKFEEVKTIDEAIDEMLNTIDRMIWKIQNSYWNDLKKIILCFSGDYFQADDSNSETGHGNRRGTVDQPEAMQTKGSKAAFRICEKLRKIAPLEVTHTKGNHDPSNLHGMMWGIQNTYNFNDVDNVDVELNKNKRSYTLFGNKLLVFTHGDNHHEMKNLTEIASHEARNLWGKADHTIEIHGHEHYFSIDDGGPASTRVGCPALADKNEYEDREGYVGSQRGLQCLVMQEEEPEMDPVSVAI